MIALDSNVLLRLLLDDPEEQAVLQRVRATRRVEDAETTGTPLFVSDVVLCEVVWTMRRTYRVPRATVGETVGGLPTSPTT